MSVMRIGKLQLQLQRKPIKHLHISVVPPEGKVRISAPERMTETAIRMAVISRIPWIKKQQKGFTEQPRQSERQMVSGESHYLWGRHYRLKVIERAGRHEVQWAGGRGLRLLVNPSASVEKRTQLLAEFYREQMRQRLEELLPKWMQRLGVKVTYCGIKKMKTKWGSCNTQAGRIWLNLELCKKPPECLEYILVHELVHLLERHHNERFKQHMDRLLPDWRERRDLLNKAPLAFESWAY